jgi:hypothetical protein
MFDVGLLSEHNAGLACGLVSSFGVSLAFTFGQIAEFDSHAPIDASGNEAGAQAI